MGQFSSHEFSHQLKNLSDDELGPAWAAVMREMHTRKLIRSWNNPVADYAERIVALRLNLTLADKSARGFDATDSDEQVRYQIKSRRLTRENPSRQLGVIRKLEDNEFDFLIAAIFDEELKLSEMWSIPHEVVKEFAKYVPTLNGHRITVRKPLIDHDSVERIF